MIKLHSFLVSLAGHDAARRAASNISKFLWLGMDESYCNSLCSELTKGCGDWGWPPEIQRDLQPLMDDACAKVIGHVDRRGEA